jgi:hypothetical protein
MTQESADPLQADGGKGATTFMIDPQIKPGGQGYLGFSYSHGEG